MQLRSVIFLVGALAVTACEKPATRDDLGAEPARTTTQTDKPTTTGTQPTATEPARTPTTTMTNVYTPTVDPTAERAKPAEALVATLYGTKDYKDVRGKVNLRRTANTVQVDGDFDNLAAGKYHYVLHTFGDCSNPEGGSVGPELDLAKLKGATTGTTPTTPTTGAPPAGTPPTATPPVGAKPGMQGMEMPGSLGMLDAKAGVSTTARQTLTQLSPEMLGLLNGRAIAVHAMPDAAKAGAKGRIVACGVVGIARDTTPATPTDILDPEQREMRGMPEPTGSLGRPAAERRPN